MSEDLYAYRNMSRLINAISTELLADYCQAYRKGIVNAEALPIWQADLLVLAGFIEQEPGVGDRLLGIAGWMRDHFTETFLASRTSGEAAKQMNGMLDNIRMAAEWARLQFAPQSRRVSA